MNIISKKNIPQSIKDFIRSHQAKKTDLITQRISNYTLTGIKTFSQQDLNKDKVQDDSKGEKKTQRQNIHFLIKEQQQFENFPSSKLRKSSNKSANKHPIKPQIKIQFSQNCKTQNESVKLKQQGPVFQYEKVEMKNQVNKKFNDVQDIQKQKWIETFKLKKLSDLHNLNTQSTAECFTTGTGRNLYKNSNKQWQLSNLNDSSIENEIKQLNDQNKIRSQTQRISEFILCQQEQNLANVKRQTDLLSERNETKSTQKIHDLPTFIKHQKQIPLKRKQAPMKQQTQLKSQNDPPCRPKILQSAKRRNQTIQTTQQVKNIKKETNKTIQPDKLITTSLNSPQNRKVNIYYKVQQNLLVMDKNIKQLSSAIQQVCLANNTINQKQQRITNDTSSARKSKKLSLSKNLQFSQLIYPSVRQGENVQLLNSLIQVQQKTLIQPQFKGIYLNNPNQICKLNSTEPIPDLKSSLMVGSLQVVQVNHLSMNMDQDGSLFLISDKQFQSHCAHSNASPYGNKCEQCSYQLFQQANLNNSKKNHQIFDIGNQVIYEDELQNYPSNFDVSPQKANQKQSHRDQNMTAQKIQRHIKINPNHQKAFIRKQNPPKSLESKTQIKPFTSKVLNYQLYKDYKNKSLSKRQVKLTPYHQNKDYKMIQLPYMYNQSQEIKCVSSISPKYIKSKVYYVKG